MKLLLKIPFRLAANFMLLLLFLVLLFHLGVIFDWIPNNIVWGGRIETKEELLMLEFVSLFVNTGLLWIIVQRANYVRSIVPENGLKFILWSMAGVFILNTIGNLTALNSFEKFIFTPLTFIASVFCIRLGIEKQQ